MRMRSQTVVEATGDRKYGPLAFEHVARATVVPKYWQ
jgi:hypothetical protein